MVSREPAKSGWADIAADWIISLVTAFVFVFLVRTFLFEVYAVQGSSMYPSLVHDERLIVDKLGCRVSGFGKGDIIVFRSPKDSRRDFIKRVVATGGDTVSMKYGKVYVNGRELEEGYVWREDPKGKNLSNYRERTVPEGSVFVLGDNRNNSDDSRFDDVGMVPLELVKGRAVAVFLPVGSVRIAR